MLQTGSGTIDPILGVRLIADWGGIGASLGVSARLPFYENRYGFQGGVLVGVDARVNVRPIDGVQIGFGVEAEHRWRDLLDGDRIEEGGGFRIALRPTLRLSLIEDVDFFLGAQIPIYRNPDVRVLDTDVAWEAGFSIVF